MLLLPPKGSVRQNLQDVKRRWPGFSVRQFTPLGQGGSAVLLEDISAVEVTALIEMIMERGMDGSEILQGLPVPEFRNRPVSSSAWLMRVFGPVVEPAIALLSGSGAEHLCRPAQGIARISRVSCSVATARPAASAWWRTLRISSALVGLPYSA